METKVRLASNEEQALREVKNLQAEGYNLDEIYVLTHDSDRTEGVAEMTNTNEIGVSEEGFMNAVANLFRSKGDELRAKIESLGLSESEANTYEKELDKGKILVIAYTDRDGDNYNHNKGPLDEETTLPPTGIYMSGRDNQNSNLF
ncbi:general stress protein [Paenibacillus sp. FJAT-26967]|uniref:general stress protein n=1 Tax=Paenibacillus sp. FJAT-26967 TaxID=1729690 RepID=UPI000838C2B0|nr:general stress protein [Paenibacillus sp. FJAT-26967]